MVAAFAHLAHGTEQPARANQLHPHLTLAGVHRERWFLQICSIISVFALFIGISPRAAELPPRGASLWCYQQSDRDAPASWTPGVRPVSMKPSLKPPIPIELPGKTGIDWPGARRCEHPPSAAEGGRARGVADTVGSSH